MAIETLDDIVTEIANAVGIWGGCREHEQGRDCDGEGRQCRGCFEADITARIREAVSIERALTRGRAAIPSEEEK
jgi:hypothetical protein